MDWHLIVKAAWDWLMVAFILLWIIGAILWALKVLFWPIRQIKNISQIWR